MKRIAAVIALLILSGSAEATNKVVVQTVQAPVVQRQVVRQRVVAAPVVQRQVVRQVVTPVVQQQVVRQVVAPVVQQQAVVQRQVIQYVQPVQQFVQPQFVQPQLQMIQVPVLQSVQAVSGCHQ